MIDALAKLGELVKELPKAIGARGNPGGQGAKIVRSQAGTAQTYAELGLDKKTAHIAQRLADLPMNVRAATHEPGP
jgi:hypothetical protein